MLWTQAFVYNTPISRLKNHFYALVPSSPHSLPVNLRLLRSTHMLYPFSTPLKSLKRPTRSAESINLHNALYIVAMTSSVALLPAQLANTNSTRARANVYETRDRFPLDPPRILRKKKGTWNLRVAFRKSQRPIVPYISFNSSLSYVPTFSTNPDTLVPFEHAPHSSSLLCRRDTMIGLDEHDKGMQAKPPYRKAALDNLRDALLRHDDCSAHKPGAPFNGETPGTDPVYVSLPLPPHLRTEEMVVDIAFLPLPLVRATPVHAPGRHTDSRIPQIWRGRSTRHD